MEQFQCYTYAHYFLELRSSSQINVPHNLFMPDFRTAIHITALKATDTSPTVHQICTWSLASHLNSSRVP